MLHISVLWLCLQVSGMHFIWDVLHESCIHGLQFLVHCFKNCWRWHSFSPYEIPKRTECHHGTVWKYCVVTETILNCTYILVHLKNNFLFEPYSMLNKNPSLRPSAIEILKIPYIDEQLQVLKMKGILGSTY